MSTALSDQDQFPISKGETLISLQSLGEQNRSLVTMPDNLLYPVKEALNMRKAAQKCPRCESTNTKFCYYNNYDLSQPRHFCKTCRRYWTVGTAIKSISTGTVRLQANNSLARMPNNLLNPDKEALNYMHKAAKKCPRCESTDTKFCYYNNYSLSQPRHFCQTCRRYWTVGTAIKSIPMPNKHTTVSLQANNSGSTSSTTNNSNFVSPLAAAGPAGLLDLVAHHECFTPNEGIITNFSPAAYSSTPFTDGRDTSKIKNLPLRGGGVSDSIVKELCISINEDMDFTSGNFPVKFVIANEPKEITTKLMEITLGITGQAAISLLAYASTSTSSTISIPGLLYLVVGANAVGFIGTFAAMWFKKKNQAAAASVAGKIGATATACAVIAAMGMFLPSNAIWIVGFVCLLTALAVAFS